jgi:hypothetical protein
MANGVAFDALAPTAMQLVGEVQLIPMRALDAAPGTGGRVEVHVAPSQTATMGWVISVVVSVASPTVVHHAGPVHETLSRNVSLSSAGTLTRGPIVQPLPFHTMVNGWIVGLRPTPVEVSPKATQDDTAVQDTEKSTASFTPDGVGTCWLDQVEPFQTWTYAFPFEGSSWSTVATQNTEETHETLLS